ncbi:MAG: hypothetical protein NC308_06455 [Clostridium sp.]|nr:hypothetical protein [Bacteroides sp.]MCM1198513.1 hypothetical protein [Clostridium sp.]
MKTRKKMAAFAVLCSCFICLFARTCIPDKFHSIYSGCGNVTIYKADPAVCLYFHEDNYEAYLIENSVYENYAGYDTCFLQQRGVYRISTTGFFPELIYNVEKVDSNIVFCHFRPEKRNDIFHVSYRRIRADTGNFGDEVDYQDFISGFYNYWLVTDYSDLPMLNMRQTADSLPQDPEWKCLYENTLSSYFHMRSKKEDSYELELNVSTVKEQLNIVPDVKIASDDMKIDINTFLWKKRFEDVAKGMANCAEVRLRKPLIYLPFPLGCSAYIINKDYITSFNYDTLYCGDQNFYALYYDLPKCYRSICNVVSYDNNGVLAEVLPEFHDVGYKFGLVPLNRKIAMGYISNSKEFMKRLRKLKKTGGENIVWNDIMQADMATDTMSAYDPQVFINAKPLLGKYHSKMKELSRRKDSLH